MICDLLKREKDLPMQAAEDGAIFKAPDPSKLEMREVEKAFARLFLSQDGKTVLSHLQTQTFQRALGPGASDEQLRHMDGQRAVIATILRLIDRGRNAA